MLNLWQSFGFFDSKVNESIIKQISEILVCSGRFILDIFNYDFFVNHQGKYEFCRKGINITETKIISNGRLGIELEYHELQNRDNYSFEIYKPGEIMLLVEKYNFETILMCSNHNMGIPPSKENPRMQFVFEKK